MVTWTVDSSYSATLSCSGPAALVLQVSITANEGIILHMRISMLLNGYEPVGYTVCL